MHKYMICDHGELFTYEEYVGLTSEQVNMLNIWLNTYVLLDGVYGTVINNG